MEIRVEKTKLMTNNASGINTEIKIKGQKPETVTSFKYTASVMMLSRNMLKSVPTSSRQSDHTKTS